MNNRAANEHGASAGVSRIVLVVDDYAGDRDMLRMFLTHEGFRCDHAVDGRDAILKVHARRPDVILMDATMPYMDGWESIAELKADVRTRDIPIIMVTASSSQADRERAAAAGVARFLAKPVAPDRVVAAIREVL
jgi:CheY-like chemotaxis protein